MSVKNNLSTYLSRIKDHEDQGLLIVTFLTSMSPPTSKHQ